jgi:hypothetical protein
MRGCSSSLIRHFQPGLEAFYPGIASCEARMSNERLMQFLKSGRDWERRATTVPGIFILRLPGDSKRPASLAVELNPVDDLGRPTKKRGLVLRSSEELEAFRRLINDEKLTILIGKIGEVNPRKDVVKRRGGAGEEVFEI